MTGPPPSSPRLRSSEGRNPLVIWWAGHAPDKVRLKDSPLSVLLMPFERWIDGSRAAGKSEEKNFVAGRGPDRRRVVPFVVQRVHRVSVPLARVPHRVAHRLLRRRPIQLRADGFGNASFGSGWVGLQCNLVGNWRHRSLRFCARVRTTAHRSTVGATSGTVSGTPSVPGNFGFAISVSDAKGASKQQSLQITVASAPVTTGGNSFPTCSRVAVGRLRAGAAKFRGLLAFALRRH